MSAVRERLTNRRLSETLAFECNGLSHLASISRFQDGRLAEIFISNSKAGSHADSTCKDAAVVCSIALQHGCPAQVLRKALTRDAHGNASGPLGVALDAILGDGQ